MRKPGKIATGLLIATVGVALLATGCAAPKKPVEDVRLVWPAPPQPARIKFLRSIVGEDDISRDTTFSQKILDLFSGVTPPPNRIAEPMGLAVSDDGQRLYVANARGLSVFCFDFSAQEFHEIKPLARPFGLALDAEENLYVVEQATRQISVFNRDHEKIRVVSHPSVERPAGIAIDRERGRVYLADTARLQSEEHTVKIFNLEGELIGKVGEGKGEQLGSFLFPTYITVDGDGHLYVTDTMNARVQVFDPDGSYVKTFGQRGDGWGMFDKPKGVALDGFGNVYVVDSGWSNVQIFNQKGDVLLFFGGRGPIPGMLKNPTAITIDQSNRIYVADFINHRINVYELVNTSQEDSYLDPFADAKGGDG